MGASQTFCPLTPNPNCKAMFAICHRCDRGQHYYSYIDNNRYHIGSTLWTS